MNLLDFLAGRPVSPGTAQPAEAKGASAARARLVRHGLWSGERMGQSPLLPGNYVDQVSAAYGSNPVAQRACRLVAEAVSSTPLSCARADRLRLVAERSAGQNMIETVATHLQLHGNAYIQILAGGDDEPAELYALRPDRMTVELDAMGWPLAYAYRIGGQAQRLARTDALGRCTLIHIRSANPVDDHYGMGALSAASQAIAIHNAASRWNHALLDNAARPSGAIIYDPGDSGATLSSAQFERLRDELAAQFQGSGNAGRPMLLEGGLKWQSMSLTPAEMDFQALKDSAARDIAMAFGVPPMLIGLPGDATYANYREAAKALWRQTVLPLVGNILTGINQGLATWRRAPGADDAPVQVLLDHVPALSEDRERLWAQVNAADFLSGDEKRVLLGLEPRDGEQR